MKADKIGMITSSAVAGEKLGDDGRRGQAELPVMKLESSYGGTIRASAGPIAAFVLTVLEGALVPGPVLLRYCPG